MAITEAAADIVAVSEALAIGKPANTDGAAANGPVDAVLETSMAKTVRNTPSVPVASAEAALAGGDQPTTHG